MSLPLLVDMNLSPARVDWLATQAWPAVHWSAIGAPQATDVVILAWARANRHIVFTHDLDFGMLLALTGADGPSVIQARAQNVFPEHLGPYVIAALRQHEALLALGALIVVDESTSRARVLPIRR